MKKLLLFITLFSITGAVSAQFKDPVKWTYSATKKAGKIYEIAYTAVIEKPWHIYSQTTPEGGPVATKFVYKKNPLITVAGIPKENGTLQKKHEEVFDVDVKYFDDKVTFTQTVNLKSAVKTTIAGTIEYMVCNDKECLPPKKVSFDLQLQ
ncbi:MAG: protein-disulfide reductase DsbD domain-containing protein [Panacibacter sp.]